MPIEHWMVFGTFAEQRHFEYPAAGTYSGVIINANMAAHAPGGLAAFLLDRTAGMPYIVDPLTHAFQHDAFAVMNKDGGLKSSIAGLAAEYGEPVASKVGRKPLQPRDLADPRMLEGFVERCLRFQSRQLKARMEASKDAKYLDVHESAEFRPFALVAPYFYLTESTLADWLPVNVSAARIANALSDSSPSRRFVSVVVSQGILTSRRAREKVVAAYAELDVDGCLLWVDALDEQAAGSAELRGLLALAKGLGKNGKRKVLNLHGGYFSVLAAGAPGGGAFTGVAHGPEFGEHREVVPVGGGIPIARYYIPRLHARVRYRDALRMFRTAGWLDSAAEFHGAVCDCDECVATIEGAPDNFQRFGDGTVKSVRRRHGIVRIEFPTTDAKLRCLKHYLQRKRREYVAAAKAPKGTLLDLLKTDAAEYEDLAGLDAVAHLRLWRE
ncbi:MAG: hypothetical protein IMZ62_02650, partial [Chloroflexi bacterium]|nr:hypothetical protein [Chloroflexota bacterium]